MVCLNELSVAKSMNVAISMEIQEERLMKMFSLWSDIRMVALRVLEVQYELICKCCYPFIDKARDFRGFKKKICLISFSVFIL